MNFVQMSFLAILSYALPAFGQPNHDQAIADAEQLNAAYEKYNTQGYRQLFRPSYMGNDFADRVSGYRKHLSQIETFEQKDLPRLEKQLSQFESRYGKTRAAIRKVFQEISQAGGSTSRDPAYSWEKLKEIVTAPQTTRHKLADELVKHGESAGRTHQGYKIMTAAESYDQAKQYLELAVAYEPGHAVAKKRLAAIDGEKKQRLADDEKEIDEATFPPHSSGYQGPGSVEEMAALATKYFSSKESGKDGKLLALRISGDWTVADRNILGDTLTWALPVDVALRLDDDPTTAKVVQVELITRGTDQSPPFQRHRFGNAWYIRVDNLPQTQRADGFGLLRLPLALLLILLGFAAAAPLIGTRIPALNSLIIRVKPFTPVIGVATLALGVLSVVLNIFSPLRDVLPQAAAVVVGLVVGLDLLVKRSVTRGTNTVSDNDEPPHDSGQQAQHLAGAAGEAAKQAVGKAQDLLIEKQASIRKLDAIRVPLGLGCLAVGLLHLVAGGVVLL